MLSAIRRQREQRIRRTRAKIYGTSKKPRLAIHRSNKNINLQLIDDEGGKTLVYASTSELGKTKKTKTEAAGAVGELIAKKAVEAKIAEAVLDRRFYKYHGRVKAVADGARKGGLKI